MAQTEMYSGITHQQCADFRHGKIKKKQKRGEFITPPRPTGRRSNEKGIAKPNDHEEQHAARTFVAHQNRF